MKNGFTLVELSIVLVIIGLLVGGILIGQSLVASAAISSTIAQIGRYDAAVGGFTSKFKYLPGDAPGFGGNGDGLIARHSAWAPCVTYTRDQTNLLSGEMTNFWSGLFPEQYIGQAYIPNAISGYIYRNNRFKERFPHPDIGQKGSFLIAAAASVSGVPYTVPYWCVDNNLKENYYVLVSPFNYPNFSGENSWDVFHSVAAGEFSLTVKDMLAFDQKMDDAIPGTGNVIAGSFRGGNSGASKFPSATCSLGNTYLVNNEGFQCTPMFRMGVASGNLK